MTLIGQLAVSVSGPSLFQKTCLDVLLFFSSVAFVAAQTKPLPPGPMQAKVKAACTNCHNASRITSQHKTRQQWSDQLDKMIGLGAEVPDSERAAFLSYLTKNFGPEKGTSAKAVKSPTKKTSDNTENQ